MNEIWNKTFLDNLKDKYKRNQNFLTILAHEMELFNTYINQCQNMWRELPNHLKCKKLYKDLHTVKEGQFAGAFAELISAWVLNQYFPKVLCEVQVGGFTPDFYGENDNNSFLFETYILGKDYEEKKDDNNKIAFRDEIKDVKSNYFIFLEGSPTPCDVNGFSGMAKLLQTYLDNIAETTDETHTIRNGNALVRFSATKGQEIRPVLAGWIGGIQSGDKNSQKLSNSINKKKGKYSFPHVQICIADSSIFSSTDTLIKTLIGDRQLYFDKKTFEQTGSGFTNDGFWGQKNSDFVNNLHVQGLVFITRKITEANELQLCLSLAENYHLKSGLNNIFKDIPCIFDDSFENKHILKLTPCL